MPSFAGSPRHDAAAGGKTSASIAALHGETLVDDYAWLRADNWREALQDPDELPAGDSRGAGSGERLCAEPRSATLAPLAETATAGTRRRASTRPIPIRRRATATGSTTTATGRASISWSAARPHPAARKSSFSTATSAREGNDYFEPRRRRSFARPSLARLEPRRTRFGIAQIPWRDLATGADGADMVEDTDGTIVWTCDSRGFLYTRIDDDFRTARSILHRIGDDPATDTLVFEETDPGLFVHLRGARSRRPPSSTSSDHDCSESWLIDLERPDRARRA